MTAATTIRQPTVSRAPSALILVAALAFLSGVAATVTIQGVSRDAVGGAATVQSAPTSRHAARLGADRNQPILRATIGTGPTSVSGP